MSQPKTQKKRLRTLAPFIFLAILAVVLAFLGCARHTHTVTDNTPKPPVTASSPEAEVKPSPVEAPPTAAPPAVLPPATTPAKSAASSGPAVTPEEQTKQALEPKPIQTAVPPQPRIEPAKQPAATETKAPQETAVLKQQPEKTEPKEQTKSGKPTIAVVGDSLAVGIGMTMQQHMTSYQGVGCDAAGKVSTGLISKKFYDWDKKLLDVVSSKKVTAVVVIMGGNDANNSIDGKTAGTPEWGEAYRQKAEEFLKIATNAGAKVLWVGLPAMRDPAYGERVRAVNEAAKRACETVLGCAYMEPSDTFTDATGHYVQSKEINGKKVKLRGKDGVHMTMTGYDLLCRQILNRLDKTVGLKTP